MPRARVLQPVGWLVAVQAVVLRVLQPVGWLVAVQAVVLRVLVRVWLERVKSAV